MPEMNLDFDSHEKAMPVPSEGVRETVGDAKHEGCYHIRRSTRFPSVCSSITMVDFDVGDLLLDDDDDDDDDDGADDEVGGGFLQEEEPPALRRQESIDSMPTIPLRRGSSAMYGQPSPRPPNLQLPEYHKEDSLPSLPERTVSIDSTKIDNEKERRISFAPLRRFRKLAALSRAAASGKEGRTDRAPYQPIRHGSVKRSSESWTSRSA